MKKRKSSSPEIEASTKHQKTDVEETIEIVSPGVLLEDKKDNASTQFEPAYLEMVPKELIQEIALYLPRKDQIAFMKTCKKVHTIFQPTFNDLTKSSRLLTYILQAKQAKALEMIAANPELLLETTTALDHNKKQIICSPLAAIFFTESIELLYNLFKPQPNQPTYIRRINSSAALDVLNEQVPNFSDYFKSQVAHRSPANHSVFMNSLFESITNAITNDQEMRKPQQMH